MGLTIAIVLGFALILVILGANILKEYERGRSSSDGTSWDGVTRSLGSASIARAAAKRAPG